jgi:hypothetical protein
VYYCATFLASNNYFYSTTSPPRDEFWVKVSFYYDQTSTGTRFDCALVLGNQPEPRAGSRTEHPA